MHTFTHSCTHYPSLPRPPRGWGGRAVLTDAGGDGGAALLVALGAAVAGDARHAVLTRALTRRLVTRLTGRAHRVAVTGWGEERRHRYHRHH